ncbi:Hypothetical predicted protein [Podarcis lilfordi]|uniref:Uncharacterized protein n=1 Tax=Podarcis lilfordi TaxID=74358 RepID=A0AA35LJW7_9SAUR|nr:Hypothetical predicted protein [Podarcis lilfordi]
MAAAWTEKNRGASSAPSAGGHAPNSEGKEAGLRRERATAAARGEGGGKREKEIRICRMVGAQSAPPRARGGSGGGGLLHDKCRPLIIVIIIIIMGKERGGFIYCFQL